MSTVKTNNLTGLSGVTGILYDNAVSGLTATSVQAAIDEVNSKALTNTTPITAANLTPADNTIAIGGVSNRYSDLYLAGGAYIGGTGAANYLDDYEEGTWTPVLAGATSGTYTFAGNNTYTKVSNQVTVWAEAVANNTIADIGTLSGSAIITGLPFTPAVDAVAF